jgi:hypothetical protein
VFVKQLQLYWQMGLFAPSVHNVYQQFVEVMENVEELLTRVVPVRPVQPAVEQDPFA